MAEGNRLLSEQPIIYESRGGGGEEDGEGKSLNITLVLKLDINGVAGDQPVRVSLGNVSADTVRDGV